MHQWLRIPLTILLAGFLAQPALATLASGAASASGKPSENQPRDPVRDQQARARDHRSDARGETGRLVPPKFPVDTHDVADEPAHQPFRVAYPTQADHLTSIAVAADGRRLYLTTARLRI